MSKVSVIIPNYNHAAFLQQRLDSVLQQSFQDFELIILDDCSHDDSKNIIEGYKLHEKVSTILYNEVNSGNTFAQWNKGIQYAKGSFIWIAESDDFADSSFLERTVALLDENSNIGLVYCQSFRVNTVGVVEGDWKNWTDDLNPELFSADFIYPGKDFINQYLLYKNIIPNASAVLFRKKIFEAMNGAELSIRYCADWNLWLKILSVSDVGFISTPLNYFRYHSQSVIASVKEPYFKFDVAMRKNWRAYVKSYKIKSLAKTADLFLAREYLNWGVFCFNNNQKVKGFYYVLLSSLYPVLRPIVFIRSLKYSLAKMIEA